MIRVMVVDDQEIVRAGIASLVTEEDIAVVAEAVDGEDALIQARAHRPDVILMDVRMPGIDGVTATRAVIDEGLTAQTGQPIGIVMLTTFNHDDDVTAALRAGATGFLLKTADSTQIVAAIRAVVAGKAWLDPGVITPIIKKIIKGTGASEKPIPAEVAKLTIREREVLTLMAQGMSDTDIAANLFISVVSVKTHLVRLMTKLGVRQKAQAVAVFYQFTGRPEQHTPTSAEIDELTRRERQVLILVAQGLSNAGVAAQLAISEVTVRTHLSRVLTKLGVGEKSQAVTIAYKTGLV